MTEDERSLYMESQTKFGLGIFKGKSLCLTVSDCALIHQKFIQLYKNKAVRDQEVKIAKY